MTARVKNSERTRGKPFSKGNPGRPPGSRNKARLALEAPLEGEAEAITRKPIEMALDGDTTGMRLVMDRISPPQKDRPVAFALPKLEAAADAVKATAALAQAVATGDLTPREAAELSKLVDGFTKAVEQHDVVQRLERIEAALEQRKQGTNP